MPIDHKNLRVLALALIKYQDKFLVCPGFDKIRKRHHYRLLGGGIEFGEDSRQALRREIKEELGLEISVKNLLSVEENIFVFNGLPAHEIIFLYEASFRSAKAYKRDFFPILDSRHGHQAEWVSRANLHKARVFPRSALKYL
jgi:8-oxo-dGTP pyrophosphatase MutT (NUDIX family)